VTLAEEVRRARRLPTPALARAIRQSAGVSQARLAEEVGVNRVTLTRWELGQRTPRGAARLRYADVLAELEREVLGSERPGGSLQREMTR